MTPGDNSPKFRNGSKSMLGCLDVADVSQPLLQLAAVSSILWIPAANARSVASMCWTFLSCSCTWLPSPPHSGSPHATTAPDSRMAAKAASVAWMCWTFLSCSCSWLLSRHHLDDPRSQQPQIRDWQQKHRHLLGCAGRSSAALAPGCCLLHTLNDPTPQQPQIQEWQQKRPQLLGCAGRFSAAPVPGCRLLHTLDDPTPQQPQMDITLYRRQAWNAPATLVEHSHSSIPHAHSLGAWRGVPGVGKRSRSPVSNCGGHVDSRKSLRTFIRPTSKVKVLFFDPSRKSTIWWPEKVQGPTKEQPKSTSSSKRSTRECRIAPG